VRSERGLVTGSVALVDAAGRALEGALALGEHAERNDHHAEHEQRREPARRA
jgi:hypothetical protein